MIAWLVGLNIDWGWLMPHCIMGTRDQWKYPPFFRPHWQWQSLCTASTAGICLLLGLCKGTVKESTLVQWSSCSTHVWGTHDLPWLSTTSRHHLLHWKWWLNYNIESLWPNSGRFCYHIINSEKLTTITRKIFQHERLTNTNWLTQITNIPHNTTLVLPIDIENPYRLSNCLYR